MTALTVEQKEAMNHYIGEADMFQRRLYGKVRILVQPDSDLHLRNWLIDGSTRTGKTVSLWNVAFLYSMLKFKVVVFDYPSREGANINEPGFFSLPMPERHPLYKKVVEIYGQPKTLPVKIFRPVIFSHSIPVGLGINFPEEEVPANVEPYTLPFAQLFIEDWEAILGNMSHTAYNLLSSAVRRLRGDPEASVLDLIRMIEKLSEEKEAGFLADITGLPQATPELRIGSRAFDKKSVPRLLQDLQNLASSGFILPSRVMDKDITTNIDVETLVRENDWLIFNFSPAIPQSVVFGTIRFIMRQLLWVRDQKMAIVFPEIREFAPRQIPEEKEWFLRPMRDLLILAASQHNKAGKVLLADTQHPDMIDETLRSGFRYRLHFKRDRQELEEAVRADGVVNAESLVSPQNLRLVLDERNHYCIFDMPTGQGCVVKGDAVPPFRTHVTAEGTYDTVCKNGKHPMKSLIPDFKYVIGIIEQTHHRSHTLQMAERKVQMEEEAKQTTGTKAIILGLTKELLQGNKKAQEEGLKRKDWTKYMMNRLGVTEKAIDYWTRRLHNEGLVHIDTRQKEHMLNFSMTKLEPYPIPEAPKPSEAETSGPPVEPTS